MDKKHSVQFQFSRSVVSDSLWPYELQHARPPCLSPTPGVHSNSCPSSPWCHLILCRPLLLLPPIPPSIRVFSKWVSSSHQVAKALELQHSSWLLDVDKDQLRAIIKADPLSTIQEAAEELNIDHSSIIQHLRKIAKVKSSIRGCLMNWPKFKKHHF